jgi:hypothetical protein
MSQKLSNAEIEKICKCIKWKKMASNFVTNCSSGNLPKGTEKLKLILILHCSSYNLPAPPAF